MRFRDHPQALERRPSRPGARTCAHKAWDGVWEQGKQLLPHADTRHGHRAAPHVGVGRFPVARHSREGLEPPLGVQGLQRPICRPGWCLRAIRAARNCLEGRALPGLSTQGAARGAASGSGGGRHVRGEPAGAIRSIRRMASCPQGAGTFMSLSSVLVPVRSVQFAHPATVVQVPSQLETQMASLKQP